MAELFCCLCSRWCRRCCNATATQIGSVPVQWVDLRRWFFFLLLFHFGPGSIKPFGGFAGCACRRRRRRRLDRPFISIISLSDRRSGNDADRLKCQRDRCIVQFGAYPARIFSRRGPNAPANQILIRSTTTLTGEKSIHFSRIAFYFSRLPPPAGLCDFR